MSEPIKVGDLVIVTRSCCAKFVEGPTIYDVTAIREEPRARCSFCGGDVPGGPQGVGYRHRIGVPLSWLKKVPPLDELEGVKDREELTA